MRKIAFWIAYFFINMIYFNNRVKKTRELTKLDSWSQIENRHFVYYVLDKPKNRNYAHLVEKTHALYYFRKLEYVALY